MKEEEPVCGTFLQQVGAHKIPAGPSLLNTRREDCLVFLFL